MSMPAQKEISAPRSTMQPTSGCGPTPPCIEQVSSWAIVSRCASPAGDVRYRNGDGVNEKLTHVSNT